MGDVGEPVGQEPVGQEPVADQEAAAPQGQVGRATVVSGARWSLFAAGIAQASTVVSTVVASRLLSPDEFAVVAATSVMITLYAIISSGGFGAAALVGDRDDDDSASTMFWASGAMGLAIFVLAIATAQLAANVINQPQAAATIRGAALAIPFFMTADVVQKMFFRRFRYGVAYSVDVVNAVGTSIGPVVLLMLGWGPWGVILPRTVSTILSLVVLLVVGRWLPRRRVDRALVRSSSRLSFKMFVFALARYAQGNLDYWIVGRVVSTAAFSAYYLAFVLPTILRQRATWTINGLVTPMMVRIRHDSDEMCALYGRVVRSTGALMIPTLVGLSATADLVIRIAFGPQWGEAEAPLRIMALMAGVDVATQLTNSVFLARQQAGEMTRRVVVQTVCLGLALIPVLFIRTIEAAAVASLVAVIAGAVFSQRALRKAIGFPAIDLFRLLIPVLLGSLVMAGAVLGIRQALPDFNAFVEMIVCVLVGTVAYGAVLGLVFPKTFRLMVGDMRMLTGR